MGEKASSFRRWLPALLWLPVIALALMMWFWERKPMHNHAASLLPIRFVDVQMDRSQRDRFTRQVVAFGDEFGFRTSGAGAPKLQFSLTFYGQFEKPSPSLAQIDPLVKSLKNFLADVPGLTITKEQ